MVETVVKTMKGFYVGGFCLFSVLLGAGCALRSAPPVIPSMDSAVKEDAYAQLPALAETMLLVYHHYPKDVGITNIIYGAIDGLLSGLDPNSSFLTPDMVAELDEESQGRFVGIGVTVETEPDGLRVVAPIEGSPAFKSGIRAGDLIVSVDGQSVAGRSLSQCMKLLKGEPGTTVLVTVIRGDGEPGALVLRREKIEVPAVTSVRVLDQQVGYLRVAHFSDKLSDEFAAALKTLEQQQVRGVIIDLRDNPGGLIDAAIAVSEQLLPQGQVIVTVRGRTAEDEHVFKASGGRYQAGTFPVACIVNGGSASASEIFAGALQAHHRATLVGEQTYGKASVQSVMELALCKGCAVRLTTGFYYTPDNKLIHGVGLAPDVVVPMAQSDWLKVQRLRMIEDQRGQPSKAGSKPEDLQLKRALEIVLKQSGKKGV